MRAKLAGVCLFAAALASATWTAAQEGNATAITDIRQESGDGATRLVLESTGPIAYTTYSPDPLTLVVDISDVDASKLPARINVGTPEVESVRVTNLARADGRNLARVEVRLASLVPCKPVSRDGKGLVLVFERPATAAAAALASPAPSTGAAAANPGVPAIAPAPSQPADEPAASAREMVAAPISGAGSGPRATSILGVSRDETTGLLAFTVKADGRLQYRDFHLPSPDRLVLDFADVVARSSVRTLMVGEDPVRKVRLGQFSAGDPKVARLVLDLTHKAPYRILDGPDGVRIVFGDNLAEEPGTQAPLAALRSADPASGPLVISPVARPGALEPLILPEPQAQPPAGGSAPAEGSASGEASNVGMACGQTGDLGTPISLDFRDGDLLDIFRLFSDISGLNVVVNPGVTGKVTLRLNEVPWGRALELILKTNGLGCVLEDNVIRIAPLAALQKEEKDRRQLQEEKLLAGELIEYTKRISYAKAGDLGSVLKASGALSQRGQLNVDARTNTLIIRDLPLWVEKAKNLINELDTATPQVEIEARIVITSRNFVREMGIQWGFGAQASPMFGNTTGREFPNSIVLNGSPIQGTLGLSADQRGPGGLSSAQGIGQAGRGYAVNLPAGGANTAIGISMGNVLGSFNLDLALTALERQGRGRLLSTPKITTQNNQAAEIKQGVQIPIQTMANNTVSVSFKDAVLTLKVTPQITDAGTVILNLEVENNSADFANLVEGIPPINTQAAKTIVLVKDGQTAVVGGIYQSSETLSQQRTPFLGQVPILGYLFRNRATNSTNNELLLFITPRIVKS